MDWNKEYYQQCSIQSAFEDMQMGKFKLRKIDF